MNWIFRLFLVLIFSFIFSYSAFAQNEDSPSWFKEVEDSKHAPISEDITTKKVLSRLRIPLGLSGKEYLELGKKFEFGSDTAVPDYVKASEAYSIEDKLGEIEAHGRLTDLIYAGVSFCGISYREVTTLNVAINTSINSCSYNLEIKEPLPYSSNSRRRIKELQTLAATGRNDAKESLAY